MNLGIFTYNTEYTMPITELAPEVEARGCESLWVPEHTHIPASRETPYPGGGTLPDEYAHMMDPLASLAGAAGGQGAESVGVDPGAGIESPALAHDHGGVRRRRNARLVWKGMEERVAHGAKSGGLEPQGQVPCGSAEIVGQAVAPAEIVGREVGQVFEHPLEVEGRGLGLLVGRGVRRGGGVGVRWNRGTRLVAAPERQDHAERGRQGSQGRRDRRERHGT